MCLAVPMRIKSVDGFAAVCEDGLFERFGPAVMQIGAFRNNPPQRLGAKLIAFGDSKPNPALDVVELAAHTLTANVLLNLDEFDNVSLYEGAVEQILPALYVRPTLVVVLPPPAGGGLIAVTKISLPSGRSCTCLMKPAEILAL